MALRFHRPLDWRYWRTWIADRTGWTLDYIDSLDAAETRQLIEIWQNADTAHAQNQHRAAQHARRR